MAAKSLPDRPHVEHYRRQAKELLRDLTRADPAALERVRQHHPKFGDAAPGVTLKLADAQLVLAREHGFASWPLFQAHLRDMAGQNRAPTATTIAVQEGALAVDIRAGRDSKGVVLFVVAGDVGRRHPGVLQIADRLNDAGFHIVLADLFTDEEALEDALHEELRYDLVLLKKRLNVIVDWIESHAPFAGLPLSLYGTGTGGGAAILFAGERPQSVRAMICAAGHPDLAGPWIWRVRAPTLFLTGIEDLVARRFTKSALTVFPRDVAHRFEVVDGAKHRFEEGPVAAKVAELATAWLEDHALLRTAGVEVRP